MGSRVHATGTVFSRVQGLIRSGVIKPEEKPVWYNVWKAFPPRDPPMARRSAPDSVVPEILYPEDLVRAKYYKRYNEMMNDLDIRHKYREAIDLCSEENSRSQRFIEEYITTHKAEGIVDFEDFFLQFLEKEQASITELYNSPALKAERTLYVSGLPSNTSMYVLQKAFTKYGKIEDIRRQIGDEKLTNVGIVFEDAAIIDSILEEKEIQILDTTVNVMRYSELKNDSAVVIDDITVMDSNWLKNYKHPTIEQMFGEFKTKKDDIDDTMDDNVDDGSSVDDPDVTRQKENRETKPPIVPILRKHVHEVSVMSNGWPPSPESDFCRSLQMTWTASPRKLGSMSYDKTALSRLETKGLRLMGGGVIVGGVVVVVGGGGGVVGVCGGDDDDDDDDDDGGGGGGGRAVGGVVVVGCCCCSCCWWWCCCCCWLLLLLVVVVVMMIMMMMMMIMMVVVVVVVALLVVLLVVVVVLVVVGGVVVVVGCCCCWLWWW
ncbi:hypothetical protein FSP39_024212 [Pinctada imbricata]|uniref:Small ribosomal subunit protein mS23 n=1 Tax=Pinctada imbricata TaxID=66713 RepID=A0AA88XGW8_PINIB|nr:hypothetical protein FSP39_024212 [Pinctada imbricata]